MRKPITRLREADPALRVDLDVVHDDTWDGLVGAIAAGPQPAPATRTASPPHRRRRRALMASALALVLAGGGVAYAVIVRHGETAIECRPAGADGEAVSTPELTGDPIEDCAIALEDEGREPIVNPVAYRVPDSNVVVVVPSDRVPDGVTPLDSRYRTTSPTVLELRQSVMDRVDGGLSTCRSVADQAEWARSELTRLHLDDWSVVLTPTGPATSRRCSNLGAEVAGVLSVFPDVDPAGDFVAGDWPLADRLRTAISDRCLSLDDARAAADAAIAAEYADPWPTTSVVDETVDCARVDASIGGNVQVTVYGPTKAAR